MGNFISEIWNNSTHGERCLIVVCGTAVSAGAIYAGHRAVNHLIDTHDYVSDNFSIVRSRRPELRNHSSKRRSQRLSQQKRNAFLPE